MIITQTFGTYTYSQEAGEEQHYNTMDREHLVQEWTSILREEPIECICLDYLMESTVQRLI